MILVQPSQQRHISFLLSCVSLSPYTASVHTSHKSMPAGVKGIVCGGLLLLPLVQAFLPFTPLSPQSKAIGRGSALFSTAEPDTVVSPFETGFNKVSKYPR